MSEGEAIQELPLFSSASSNMVAEVEVSLESTLIARVRNGDQEAFTELYRIYAPTIHSVVLSRVPRDEVQDIVQEVFLTAYRKIDTLRNDDVFGPWVVKIARNQAIEFYRRLKSTEELNEEFHQTENRQSEAAEVLRAIRSLSDAYSETLIMRLIEGMSAKEIAERTGLKPDSVRVNLHRGMELLRERLGINGAKR
jgi:RNA polymerase sigma-70 factor (ECF subfamily)